jgi:pilus assembly protein Flp/PilA
LDPRGTNAARGRAYWPLHRTEFVRDARPNLEGKEVNDPVTRLYVLVSSFLVRDDEGQGLAEYALILALIAIVAIVALIFLGGQVSKILSTVGKSV